ncbi:hypothetical protein OIDMADRAFT_32579 [Oidiodendron maius Zn]|uniref:SKP1 component dimerisation domain-containing protein n=1 Tax=Oidiodendron maius (strain Zn) TaxID=913774 RepID=A0A0C3H2B6_OIDMZ|nr:hypothetical protein OIDMADRAFT_32579 [Oidiodendron maius Zn]
MAHLLEINGPDGDNFETKSIPLYEVRFCIYKQGEYHKNEPVAPDVDDDPTIRKRTDDISDWDRNFMDVEQDLLFKLTLAANYLEIRPLLNLCCKTLANIIKGNSPEQIRERFNIENPFTEEEEEQIRRENEWIEEPDDTALGH